MKIVVMVILAGILASLGSALFYLVRDKGDSGRMARALTLRISLSVALFLMLFAAWFAGLIQPHGVGQ